MPKERLEALTTEQTISDMVNAGRTRKEIMGWLQDEKGMTASSARDLYYDTLKGMAPNTAMFDAYKASLIQTNLDRLESIIQGSISGSTAEKMVALKAIDQMSKMIGAYNDGSKVTIAGNKEGEQIIQITFGQ